MSTDDLKAELERLKKENEALRANKTATATKEVRIEYIVSEPKAPKKKGRRRKEEVVEPVDVELYPHQVEGIAWLKARMKAHQSSILGDDMGLGKTIQSLFSADDKAPILVICPLIAKNVWKRETQKFTHWRKVCVIKKRADFRWPEPGEVLVINFDSLPKLEFKPQKDSDGKIIKQKVKKVDEKGNTQEVEEIVYEEYPSLPDDLANSLPAGMAIFVDEAQKVKNPKAKKTQALRSISYVARKKNGSFTELTGTPMMNKPQEIWALLVAGGMQFDTFGDFGKHKYERAMKMAGGVQGKYGWTFYPDRVSPEFAQRISRVMLRRTKEEVLDLPPKRFETLEVDIPLDDVGPANEVLEILANAGIDIDETDLEKLRGGIVFEKMSAARRALAKAKIGPLIELIETVEEQEQIPIVFSYHLDPVNELAKREGWRKITGEESQSQRQEAEDLFQAGKLKGLACTIRSTGVALTLTRADRVIFVDKDWNPANNNQAIDRAYRIGQNKSILVSTLVANHALDERLEMLLEFKQAMVDATVERVREFQRPDQPIAPPLPRPRPEDMDRKPVPKPAPKPVELSKVEKPIPPLPAGVSKTSKEGIIHYLKHSDAAVEKALVVLYQRQTADERASDRTKHQNGVGFSGVDAGFGSYLAKWVLGGKHLNGKYLDDARKMVMKYAGQLVEAAQ